LFSRSEILKITKVSSSFWVWCRKNGLIPGPSKILKFLNEKSEVRYPHYLIHDLFQLSTLRKLGKGLGEVKRLTFGGTGKIKYESDIKKETGLVVIIKEQPNLTQAILEIDHRTNELVSQHYPNRKVIHLTLRWVRIGEEDFLVLSRLILTRRHELVFSSDLVFNTDITREEIGFLLPYAKVLLE